MDIVDYGRFIFGLLVVGGLLALFAIGLRYVSTHNMRLVSVLAAKKERRLSIIESLPIDPRRRLVLVQADQTEYLILIGGGTDTVISPALSTQPSALPTTSEHSEQGHDRGSYIP